MKHSTRANCPSLRLDGATIGSYVEDGGGLVMVGGYLTFGGIEGKARWAGTPVETALPVSIATIDDRVEVPSGAAPTVHLPDHPIAASLTDAWPVLLGYNQVMAKAGADIVVTVGDDPLIVAVARGLGRQLSCRAGPVT